jgi:glycosyltransferase involved in cell wall biosynthesis
VIYSGVDPPAEDPLPLPFEPPIMLSGGRHSTEKGFDLVLRATAILAQRGEPTELVLLGDGPEREALERLAGELDISTLVRFTGWVKPTHIWHLLQNATVVVIPSRWDAFPRLAVEASLMQRPVVASRVGGLAEAVLNGETGLLVAPEDPQALADAVRTILRDRQCGSRLGRAARSHALNHFTMSGVVTAYDDLYGRLLR